MTNRKIENQSLEFLKLISDNKGIIYKTCYVYTRSEQDREDLKQEIILQTWKSWPGFKSKSKFSTWMYRICINTAITNIRKSKKHPVLEAFSGSESELPENENVEYLDEEVNQLYKSIAQLKDVDKAIIMLYLEEKTYKEIAEILGISEKNVGVKIVRCKEKLREIMLNKKSHV